jgi:pimeloyl-ACP methyl ester carboxylesterase
MRTVRVRAQEGASVQVILLPPAYAQPEDFLAAGFAEAVRVRGLDLDLVLLAPELAHVTDRAFLGPLGEELRNQPAGSRTWLGGVSLGAYLALCGAERHHDLLAGVLLLAPYLGSYLTVSAVGREGLKAWPAPEGPDIDEELRIWRFLKYWPDGLALHLGLGQEDRYAARHRVLAAALPAGQVDAVSGAHDWPTWRRLWDNLLDGRFPRRA